MNKISYIFTVILVLLLLSCHSKGDKQNEIGVPQYTYRGEIERDSSWETTMSYDPSIYAQGVNPLMPEYMSRIGVVSNADIAVKISEAVLFPHYGKKIEEKRPYDVFLINRKYWYIIGAPHNKPNEVSLGGTFKIIIRKCDGKVVSVIFGK